MSDMVQYCGVFFILYEAYEYRLSDWNRSIIKHSILIYATNSNSSEPINFPSSHFWNIYCRPTLSYHWVPVNLATLRNFFIFGKATHRPYRLLKTCQNTWDTDTDTSSHVITHNLIGYTLSNVDCSFLNLFLAIGPVLLANRPFQNYCISKASTKKVSDRVVRASV